LDIEERLMLEVRVLGKKKKLSLSCLAMNDCYLHAGSASRITQVEASLNGEFLTTYKGDGVIVATPTGSTAYSLAADGPVVSPQLGVLLLTPICPHTFSQRPLVISDRSRLDLAVGRDSSPMILSVDGQINRKVEPGTRIEVRAAEKKLRLLVNPKKSYFSILREKLGWGK
jgi:NAD+ kinase